MRRLPARLFSLPIGLAVAMTPLVASAAPLAAQTTDTASYIDAYLRGRMPHLRVPGFSVVVVQDDQVILSRGYGFADREAGTLMTQDTPVLIASTSKGMIALAIMQLVEQGLVELDAPVARYLPAFSMDDERAVDITVRQVLSHTSGIRPATQMAAAATSWRWQAKSPLWRTSSCALRPGLATSTPTPATPLRC